MKRKITINPEARIAYIPKELIDQGLKGEVDGYANAVTLTIVNPNTPLDDVERSLEIVLEDIRLRMKLEKRHEAEDLKRRAEIKGEINQPQLNKPGLILGKEGR